MADSSLKDQGNAEFKKGNYLKAAALYTRAIKEEPENAVLYSNRAAALIKLNKVTKALADAEECIRLNPEWEKGYFRKAGALEAMDKYPQALDSYQLAHQLNPGNKEVTAKVRNLTRYIKATSKTSTGQEKVTSQVPVNGQGPLEDAGVTSFLEEVRELTRLEIADHGDDFAPMTHFYTSGSGRDKEGQKPHSVRGEQAFSSPEAYASFVSYLRTMGQELGALAACSVVPKARVSYPQKWNGRGGRVGQAPGVLVQLDDGCRLRVLFLEVADKKVVGEEEVEDDLAPLPPVLRREAT